ncbi:MAG: class I SAM-dependent RNA methyltransferase, partial [Spirochaetales bacterium]
MANEIKFLGYKMLSNAPGRVIYECPPEGLFRSNLCLRTADRVYIQVSSFFAENFDELFDGVYAIDWHNYFKKDVRLHIDKVRTFRSKLSSEHSVQKLTHKAICKKLGEIWHMNTLPESGNEADIRIYIDQNTVLVLLDISGAPLNRRGYRKDGGTAPIRETLAAILLHMMCWRRKTPLHDPFCGSGTLLTEAMLYAHNVAPGFGRRFALENLIIFDSAQADEIRKQEAAKIRTDVMTRITGTDIDPDAVERSRANAERACVTAGRALQLIGSDMKIMRPQFDVSDFKDLAAPYPCEDGILLR